MAATIDEFVRSLSDSGLMTAEEIEAFLKGLPNERQPGDARELGQEMVRQKRLTKFQAQAVYQKRIKGLVLGNYAILDKLGEGGMGQVFKAQHRRMDRLVALKIVSATATRSADAVERFQREVRAAARLSHPNIVRAYDADEDHGIHFLVMEHVEGTDLASLVQQEGRLSVDRAVDYVLQAARGLEYAHKQKIIHRDIKPSNLLVDTDGLVQILDMGLARFEQDVGSDDATAAQGLTQTGQVMGTVDYMSPEQAADTRKADQRSDVYSLGCTLWYLIIGEPIYGGSTMVEKILAHREHRVPSLYEARPGVSKSLDVVFRKMVAKDPAQRQASMGEVISGLQKCEVGAKSGATGPNPAKPSPGRAGDETIDSPRRTVAESRKAPRRTPVRQTPRHSTAGHRARDARREVKGIKQQKTIRSEMQKAIADADRDRRRRLGLGPLGMLRRLFSKTMHLVLVLGLLVLTLGGTYFAVKIVWQGTKVIGQSEERVVEALRPTLEGEKFDPVDSINFTNASRFRPLPDTLEFQAPLFGNDGAGRRPLGEITGTLDYTTGQGTWQIDRYNGADVRGIELSVKPVE